MIFKIFSNNDGKAVLIHATAEEPAYIVASAVTIVDKLANYLGGSSYGSYVAVNGGRAGNTDLGTDTVHVRFISHDEFASQFENSGCR